MVPNPLIRQLILVGTPLTLTILMLFHPWPYSDVLGQLVPIAEWWTILHTLQFILFAFMGAAVWLMTDGLHGVAIMVSRVGALVFALFYNIGDAVAGISTGLLAMSIADAPSGERATATAGAIETLFRDPLKSLFFAIGEYGWDVALIAAGVGLYRAGAPRVPLLLLALPVILVHHDHAVPYGSLTFGSFFIVALWLELSSFSSSSESAAPKPTGSST
ncbi:MAG: hypothetical protein JOZ19_13645 [Rubrobacter sp.]|nr:hypothetical protein [Rubrobacter sp.]